MQREITPESQQMKGLLSVSALHLYSGGGSGRSRKRFLGALYQADFADWICFNYACTLIKYHPSPKHTPYQVDGGSKHSWLQYDLCLGCACPKPFIFHRFWNELMLSTAMKPDKHTLYFSSTSSEHHHINPLAPFQSIFPLTLPRHLCPGHLKDRWRQQSLLK